MNGDPLKFFEIALSYKSNDCLYWPYARAKFGYAVMGWDGKKKEVHRIICEKVYGPPPTSKHETAHSCGNGHLGCINPRHLRWDTHKGNLLDRINHGTISRGTNHGMVKLTVEDVIKIRESNKMPQQRIADKFGISQAHVSNIINKKIWKDLI